MKNGYDEDDFEFMKDLLLETDLTLQEIANQLEWKLSDLNKVINQHGLSWAKKKRRKLSRGQTALTDIMRKLLPGEEVINEHMVGDGLFLDVYCPKWKLAAEYHGRQHFFYTGMFHNSIDEFKAGVLRDERKADLCQKQGIALVVFRYTDKLDEDLVYARLLEAIKNSDYESSEVSFYDKMKSKKRLRDRQLYQEMKERRSKIGKDTK